MEIKTIKLINIKSNGNIRGKISKDSVAELSRSINVNGLLAPLVVQKNGKLFTLIAGHRRLKAIEMLKWTEVPAVIYQETHDINIKVIQLVENIQRVDLEIFMEAKAFRNAMLEHKLTYKQIHELTGKSIKYIVSRERLNNLIGVFKDSVKENELQLTVAMIIARLNKEQQKQFLDYYDDQNFEYLDENDVHNWIERHLMNTLVNVPFDVVNAKAGGSYKTSCISCNYNSVNSSLFPELEKNNARCLEPNCYALKLDFQFCLIADGMKKSGTEFVCISTKHGTDNKQTAFAKSQGVPRLNADEYRKYAKNLGVKKWVGLLLDGPNMTKVVDIALEIDIDLKVQEKASKKSNTQATSDNPTPVNEKGKDGKTVDERYYRRIDMTKMNEAQENLQMILIEAAKKKYSYKMDDVLEADLDILFRWAISEISYSNLDIVNHYTGMKLSGDFNESSNNFLKAVLKDCKTGSEKLVRIILITMISKLSKDAEPNYNRSYWRTALVNYCISLDVDTIAIAKKIKPAYEKKRKKALENFESKNGRKPTRSK